MTITRVAVAAVAFASACGDGGSDPPPVHGYPEIPLPLARDHDPRPQIVEVHLEARAAAISLRPPALVAMWSYDGVVPGPLVRARVGDTLVVRFHNRLPEPTTIHWHGLRVPNDMDGSHLTQLDIPPGGRFDYRFALPDAGTYWYHPHLASNKQVGLGLYGAIVVEAPNEPPELGREAVLVLSDVSLHPSHRAISPHDEGGIEAGLEGREGDVVLVNGREKPTVQVDIGRRQRWRLVNAARSRFFRLRIPGHQLTRIGGDGGFLGAPLAGLDELLLVPGERADVVLVPTGEPGSRIPVELVPTERGMTASPAPATTLMTLALGGLTPPQGPPPPLPAHAAAIAPLVPSPDDVEHPIHIGQRDQGFVVNDQPASGHQHLRGKVGETQVFAIFNHTRFDHPFHLHGFFFQMLDPATSGALPVIEWKDTANVPALSARRFAVRYDDRPGMWMFHCHILDHAALGLSGVLEVTR